VKWQDLAPVWSPSGHQVHAYSLVCNRARLRGEVSVRRREGLGRRAVRLDGHVLKPGNGVMRCRQLTRTEWPTAPALRCLHADAWRVRVCQRICCRSGGCRFESRLALAKQEDRNSFFTKGYGLLAFLTWRPSIQKIGRNWQHLAVHSTASF